MLYILECICDQVGQATWLQMYLGPKDMLEVTSQIIDT